MNIEPKTQITTSISTNSTSPSVQKTEDSAKFTDELKNLSAKKTEETAQKSSKEEENVKEAKNKKEKIEENKTEEKNEEVENLTDGKEESKDVSSAEALQTQNAASNPDKQTDNEFKLLNYNKAQKPPQKTDIDKNIDNTINGLKDAVEEINNKLNQTDEKKFNHLKPEDMFADKNKNEADNLINNDMNIQEPKDRQFTPQMNLNMNLNSGGQPFADFMNNQEREQKLSLSEKELLEEKAILSTMDENIAIANKNMALMQQEQTVVEESAPKTKTVINSEGVKKVDKKTNVTVETVVKYDNVIMDKTDVEFFTNLVEKGSAEASQQTAKSSQVSKTLADLLAKSMNENKPVRIDFDNNISVIIKVSRNGKISADFLPSSQVAEACLKENLPLLRQRFDDNNIEYDELNQRKQRQEDDKENRKKGRQDE